MLFTGIYAVEFIVDDEVIGMRPSSRTSDDGVWGDPRIDEEFLDSKASVKAVDTITGAIVGDFGPGFDPKGQYPSCPSGWNDD